MIDNCITAQQQLSGFSLVKSCDVIKNGVLRLATPMLYPDGSNVDLFVKNDLVDVTVSDMGQTVAYLADLNIFPYRTQKRKLILSDICQTLNVSERNGELFVTLRQDDMGLANAIARLAQACIRVADLCYTQRFRLESSFKEDLEEFFSDSSIKYKTNVAIEGRYDKPVVVDFSTQGRQSENLVITLSSANTTASHPLATEVFRKWYDLDRVRDKYGFITIYDSSNNALRDDDLSRCQEFSSLYGYPAQASELSDILVA